LSAEGENRHCAKMTVKLSGKRTAQLTELWKAVRHRRGKRIMRGISQVIIDREMGGTFWYSYAGIAVHFVFRRYLSAGRFAWQII